MHRRRTLLIITKTQKQLRLRLDGLPRSPHPLRLEQAHVAQWFFALSDTTRLDILEFLSQRDRSATELRVILGAPQSTIAFHLKVLRESGLVREVRAGPWKFYSVRAETLEHMISCIRTIGPGAHVGICPLSCCQGVDASRKVDML